MENTVDVQSDIIVRKMKHYLLTMMGRTFSEANDLELYRALCFSLREEILTNWAAANHTYAKEKSRIIYYISMEYMPGRLLGNNVTNLCSNDLIQSVLYKLERTFATMMNIEPDIGIGNGGLGRLASCFLDSLACQNYPAIGYGLRYQYGIFEQEIRGGEQIERPDIWLLHQNPWEFRRDTCAQTVHYCGRAEKRMNKKGEEIYDIINGDDVRAIAYDYPIVGFSHTSTFPVSTLRIWSTKESPRNFSLQRYNAGDTGSAAENTSLTDVLYPNDNNDTGKRIRLKQEFLLVSASLQDIVRNHITVYENMDEFADKVRIQINDTHPSLAVVELIRILTTQFDYSFDEAFETTQTVCSYTNHTVMKEALEEWNIQRMEELLPRQYLIIEKLNQRFNKEILIKYPNNEEKLQAMSILHSNQVRMANLTIYCTHKVNGVAKLHSELLKKTVFKDMYEMFPERFINVTNGVTQRRWLLHCNPKLADFISRHIGYEWITDFSQLSKLKEHASKPEVQKEFLEIKKVNKQYLIDALGPHAKEKFNFHDDYAPFLSTDALFDIQIKRIHEYKRQFMAALHMMMLYFDFKENPGARKVKRVLIVGGKAAPGYAMAKSIIRLIYCISRMIERDSAAREWLKVLYVENYNVSKAEVLIPAADVSEQISTASTEASGTGNMKLSINGALTVGTQDGANIEMREAIGPEWWPFSFGASADDNLRMARERTYQPQDIAFEHPKIDRVLNSLIDGTLAENDAEAEDFRDLHDSIFEGVYGGAPDRYFVLNDLIPYYEAQKKVDELFLDQHKWAEYALHNIGGMGMFSTDVSIKNYAEKIWDLKPCPTDQEEVNRIREEYQKLDQCRIYPDTKN